MYNSVSNIWFLQGHINSIQLDISCARNIHNHKYLDVKKNRTNTPMKGAYNNTVELRKHI